MQFEEKLDVIEEDIAQYSRELLDILLKDRTTNENIIWATSDYTSHGELYAATEQIYANLITGVYSKLIQPRVAKAHEQKNSRTRDKAEVFTPSWICNAQNNLVDEHWFGRPNVFNVPQGNTWTATERIVFPEELLRRIAVQIASGEFGDAVGAVPQASLGDRQDRLRSEVHRCGAPLDAVSVLHPLLECVVFLGRNDRRVRETYLHSSGLRLGLAPCDDDLLPMSAELGDAGEHVLLGGLHNGACVEHDHVRLFCGRGRLEPER